ncbi:MAG: rhodanese-like domain-containing protein [Bacteroidales bacterium]|nr:MAG: rhodanese-like domain-containing protein [Bacteroidales bacterium]
MFHIKSQVTILLSLLLLPASGQDPPQQSCLKLDPHEFYIQMKLSPNHVLIDVRTFYEFRRERIPDAILARNSEELFRIADTLDLEQHLFFYCKEDFRSSKACDLLHDKGFVYVYILKEGITGWKKMNLETDKTKLKKSGRNR